MICWYGGGDYDENYARMKEYEGEEYGYVCCLFMLEICIMSVHDCTKADWRMMELEYSEA